MQKSDGMNYAPKGKSAPVCRKGDFRVGVIGLDHGHIFGMCNGLIEAGAELTGVYDPDPAKMENFRKSFPDAKAVSSEKAILEDPSVHLVASAAVPSDRGELGLRVMDHGKDYFSDKPPFTTLDQIAAARKKGRRDEQKIRRLLQRTAPCGGRRLHGDLHRRRGDRPCRPGDRDGSAPDQPFPAAGMVLPEGKVRRHPGGSRLPSDRAVSLLFRGEGRPCAFQQGGEL